MKNFNDEVQLFIFAAGLGTRLRPHTDQHPKPVLPLLGYPLGYYVLPYAEHLNVVHTVANTFHLPDQIHKLYDILNANIIFSDEKDFIQDTAGGLKYAEHLLKKDIPIVTINADEVFFAEHRKFLKTALKAHLENKALATLIVTEHPEAGKKFGAIWEKNQQVMHIGKNYPNENNYKPWHFLGIQILSNQVLNLIEKNKPQNIFYDVLIHHLPKEKIQIFPIKAQWHETGNLEDYTSAKKIIEKNMNQPDIKNHFIDLRKYPKSKLSDLS